MTSKERVLKQLNFEKTDRYPFNFWMDRRLLTQYEQQYGADFRITHYDADVIETYPLLPWPSGKGMERDGTYWMTEPAFTDWDDAKKLQWPDPNDEKVYDFIMYNLNKFPDRAIFLNIPGPFTILHGIRLMDNLYFDVYDHPEELHVLVQKIMDILNVVIKKVIELPITALYFQDDVSASSGPLFSLPMIREFIFNYFEEGIRMARKAGKPVVFHSDGNETDILDTLVEIGVNAVNPLQNEFNDFKAFKAKYHGKLAVYGGMDNTKIIPDSSVEEVHRHIRETVEILGRDGGLIFSSHDIPLHCPHENVEAMVEAIKNFK